MIIGIGTDIIEIDRIKQACENERFKEKYFTQTENQSFSAQPKRAAASLAGSFAAKEAVVKALGTGFHGFMPGDIEILRDAAGKPFVRLYGNALKTAQDLNISVIHISISHCDTFATAVAVAESR